MSVVTKNIARYVEKKGVNLSKLARETNIPYNCLYVSLCEKSRGRDLRDDELIKICQHLGVNPMDFAEQQAQMEGGRNG